jgi:hypothetical protein
VNSLLRYSLKIKITSAVQRKVNSRGFHSIQMRKSIMITYPTYVRFEVLTAVKTSIMVFWVMTRRGLVVGYHSLFTLKTEAIRSSETLVTSYKTTVRHNPEDHSRHPVYVGCLVMHYF